MRPTLPVLLLALSTLTATAQPSQQPPTPDTNPQLTVQGRGVQIYTCTAGVWTFTAPAADLSDHDMKVGAHTAGPTWTWSDGSSLRGKLIQSTPAPDPAHNIPWLLLSATPTSDTPGQLTGIHFIRRTETSGGIAPAMGCDATHNGLQARVPYIATYSFYR